MHATATAVQSMHRCSLVIIRMCMRACPCMCTIRLSVRAALAILYIFIMFVLMRFLLTERVVNTKTQTQNQCSLFGAVNFVSDVDFK